MRMRVVVVPTLTLVSMLAAPTAAVAGPADVFPQQGHLTVANDANFTLTHETVGGGPDQTNFLLLPAADYFVIDNLSVGGAVVIAHTSIGDTGITTFGLGPRVGYDIPIAEQFSFWPRGGFEFTSVSVSTGNVSNSTSHLALVLTAPFLFHPAEHFFLGIGPLFYADLTGDNKVTLFGLGFTVGGYFGS